MSIPSTQFEMYGELINGFDIKMPCANGSDCFGERGIKPKDRYFVDKITDKTYCLLCGKQLRYHRKKAEQRGEEMPRTFEDVARRHAIAGV